MLENNDHQKFLDIISTNSQIRETLQELGVFIVNYVDGTSISNNLWQEWGYEKNDLIQTLEWINLIHPEDRAQVLKDKTEIVAKKNQTLHKSIYRFRKKDGSYAWIISAGKFLSYTDANEPKIYIGADIDISKIKEAEFALKEATTLAESAALESETLLEIGTIISSSLEIKETSSQILSQISNLVAFDVGIIFLVQNRQFEIVSMTTKEDTNINQLINSSFTLCETDKGFGDQIVRHKKPLMCNNITKQFSNFKQIYNHRPSNSVIGIPLLSRGELIGLMSISSFECDAFTDSNFNLLSRLGSTVAVALDNSRLHEKMSEMALKDSLTNLLNRYGLTLHWNQLFQQALRYKRAMSLVIVDIDDFKNINDTYGHDIGDQVIQTIARLLSKNSRSSDIVARYGGDEYIIILPEVSLKEAQKAAEKLRVNVENTAMEGINAQVTISLGVSTANIEERENLETLIRKADKELYQAKQNGRNRVCPCVIDEL